MNLELATPSATEKGTLKKADKLVLIGLLALTCMITLAVLAVLYLLPAYGLSIIHHRLPIIMGVVTVFLGLSVICAGGLLVIVTFLGRDVPFSRKLRSITIKGLLPVLIVVGKLVGLKREQVQHAFVAVNNEWVLAQCRNGRRPERILLLMPHCLQDKDCTVKITRQPKPSRMISRTGVSFIKKTVHK